tara:strand:+ start:64 stop:438 length:375 start_codon:yes stop_codon:yes gene_type:complete
MALPALGYLAAPVIAGNAMTALRMAGAVAGLAGLGKGIYDAGQKSGKNKALSTQARHNQALNQMYGVAPRMPMSRMPIYGHGMHNPRHVGDWLGATVASARTPTYGGNHAPVSIGNPYNQYMQY